MCDKFLIISFEIKPRVLGKSRFVDDRTRDITFGFIRAIAHNLEQEIPADIRNLCLIYYYETEEFALHSESLKISSSEENKHNDIVEQIDDGSWCSVLGKTIIDPEKSPSSIYIWQLKITAPNHDETSPTIGILEADMDYITKQNSDCPMDMYCFNFSNFELQYYAWATGYGETDISENQQGMHYQYGSKDEINEEKLANIFTMELNIPNKSLKFSLNDEEQGIVSNNIDIEKKYCLAISFAGKGFKTELLSFEIKRSGNN